jgi:hypothetical protein
MLPGKTIIRACPGCGGQVLESTLASGNTLGARYWTDGKRDAPMLPEAPWLVRCPACAELFWVDEAEELGGIEPFEGPSEEWADARSAETPTAAEYLAFLERGGLTEDKEAYVRIRAWWLENDARREAADQPPISDAQRVNLEALAGMLEEDDPDQLVMKAETLRERGLFDKAAALLEAPLPDPLAVPAGKIRSLCEARSADVAEIVFERD